MTISRQAAWAMRLRAWSSGFVRDRWGGECTWRSWSSGPLWTAHRDGLTSCRPDICSSCSWSACWSERAWVGCVDTWCTGSSAHSHQASCYYSSICSLPGRDHRHRHHLLVLDPVFPSKIRSRRWFNRWGWYNDGQSFAKHLLGNFEWRRSQKSRRLWDSQRRSSVGKRKVWPWDRRHRNRVVLGRDSFCSSKDQELCRWTEI